MAKASHITEIDVDAQAIYALRASPSRRPWELAAAETRHAYRTRMQEIVNDLASAGYEIVSAPPRRRIRSKS